MEDSDKQIRENKTTDLSDQQDKGETHKAKLLSRIDELKKTGSLPPNFKIPSFLLLRANDSTFAHVNTILTKFFENQKKS